MPIAIAVGAVAAAGIGAAASSSASNKAAKAQTDASNASNALQSQIYNENKATLAPYVDTGNRATSSINALLGLGGSSQSGAPTVMHPGDYGDGSYPPAAAAPGPSAADQATAAFNSYKTGDEYQSRLQQGQNSVTAALGSKGLLDSGAAQKALLNYGQTAASDEFGKYLGYLQGQQQTGLSAASAQAGVGQGYANSVSANNSAAATATGNAALSGANSINGVLGTGLSALAYTQGLGSSYGGGQSMSSGLRSAFGGR